MVESTRLSSFLIFRNIENSDIDILLKCIGARCVFYERGEFISLSDSITHYVGVIYQGYVHMVKEDVWGNKSIFTIVNEGEVFGETFICNEAFAASVSFIAASDCMVLFLPFSRILHSCSQSCAFHYHLIRNMVELIAQKNIQFIDKLEITSRKTVREKILTYLSQQMQACGKTYFTSPMGRLELADYLCVDRSALTRELSNMKKDGIIDYDKNTFRLY